MWHHCMMTLPGSLSHCLEGSLPVMLLGLLQAWKEKEQTFICESLGYQGVAMTAEHHPSSWSVGRENLAVGTG